MSLCFASLPLSLAPSMPGGVAYARTMPGVTAPFGLFGESP